MITIQVKLVNKRGLHARAAALFVEMASRFDCDVRIGTEQQMVDGKNIMQVMLLAASVGTSLTLRADGSDAQDAVRALCVLVQEGFSEDEREHGAHS